MLRAAHRRTLHLEDRGVEIALLEFGNPEHPLALLHHANGFCAALWAEVAGPLSERYRVVAMDARGHGDSSKPPPPEAYAWTLFADDLASVARALVAEHPHERGAFAIGHSFGGTSTLVAASRHPGLFERIALVDPVIMPPTDSAAELPRATRPPLAELALKRRAIWNSRDEVRRSWSKPGHAFGHWTEAALELYLQEGFRDRREGGIELKCPVEVEAAVFNHHGSLDLFACAARVEVPALFLRASGGNFPRSLYEELAAVIPKARIEDIEAGHLVPMEAPELLAERLLSFGPAV